MEKRLFGLNTVGWEVTSGQVYSEESSLRVELNKGGSAVKVVEPVPGTFAIHLDMVIDGAVEISVGDRTVFWDNEGIRYTHIVGNVKLKEREFFSIKATRSSVIRLFEVLQVNPEWEDIAAALKQKFGVFEVKGFDGKPLKLELKYGPLGEELIRAKIPAITFYLLETNIEEDPIIETTDGKTEKEVLKYSGKLITVIVQVDTWCWRQDQESELLKDLTYRVRKLDYIRFWGMDHNLTLDGISNTSDEIVPFRKTLRYRLDMVGFEGFKEEPFVKTVEVELLDKEY